MSGLVEALSTAGWPTRLLTLEEWDALPEDELVRVEVAEGVVQVVPNPHPDHQGAVTHILVALHTTLPRTLRALPECDVLLSVDPLTVRGPDVLVVAKETFDRRRQRFDGSDLRLAVEVVSPGSGRTDRVTKASEYAEAGVSAYWVVHLTPRVVLTEHRLGATTYDVVAEHTGRVTLDVCGTAVELDLDALVD